MILHLYRGHLEQIGTLLAQRGTPFAKAVVERVAKAIEGTEFDDAMLPMESSYEGWRKLSFEIREDLPVVAAVIQLCAGASRVMDLMERLEA